MDTRPTLREFIAKNLPELATTLTFTQLDPEWGFLIMTSSECPGVGIAVADRHKEGGTGLRLAVKSANECAEFRAPCGCCGWTKRSFGTGKMDCDHASRDESVALVRKACADLGLSHLIFHGWRSEMEQDIDGLNLIDPYKGVGMSVLDQTRFRAAFGKFWHMETNDMSEAVPLPDRFFTN